MSRDGAWVIQKFPLKPFHNALKVLRVLMLKKVSLVILSVIVVFFLRYAYVEVAHQNYLADQFEHLQKLEALSNDQKTEDVLLEIAELSLWLEPHSGKAQKTFIRLAEWGNARANYVVGVFAAKKLLQHKNIDPYENFFERAAQKGSLNAQFILKAQEVLKSDRPPLGFDDALRQLKKAADQAYEPAITRLSAFESGIFQPVMKIQDPYAYDPDAFLDALK